MTIDKPLADPAIERLLSEPVAAVDLEGASRMWRTTRITFVFTRPPDLEAGFRLPAAIRGALGEPLRRISLERYRPDEGIGTPFAALYADHGRLEERRHVPKPFVIWTRAEAQRVFVEISLFGEAGAWRDDLIEAMLLVMRPTSLGGEGGVSLAAGKRARRIWPIEDIFWRVRGHYPPPPPRASFVLAPITPLVTSNSGTAKGNLRDLVLTIFARVTGMLRWHRLEIVPGQQLAALRDAISTLRCDFVLEPRLVSTARRSRSFGSITRLETGVVTPIRISDYPAELWPGFVLGTLVHAGYDTVQGYGRYEIIDP